VADLKSLIGKQAAARSPRAASATSVPRKTGHAGGPRKGAKVTIELNADHYRVLRIAALDLGVPATRVVRALLAEYAENQTLQRKVADRVPEWEELTR
jgi:hypothetical protein